MTIASTFGDMPGTRTQDPAEQQGELTRDEIVVIDRSNPSEKWRYTCPNGHSDWDRTNNHIWCRTGRRQYEAGMDVHPEHYHVLDKKTGELIPWERVRLAEDAE